MYTRFFLNSQSRNIPEKIWVVYFNNYLYHFWFLSWPDGFHQSKKPSLVSRSCSEISGYTLSSWVLPWKVQVSKATVHRASQDVTDFLSRVWTVYGFTANSEKSPHVCDEVMNYSGFIWSMQGFGQRNGMKVSVRLPPSLRFWHFPVANRFALSCSTTLPWKMIQSHR